MSARGTAVICLQSGFVSVATAVHCCRHHSMNRLSLCKQYRRRSVAGKTSQLTWPISPKIGAVYHCSISRSRCVMATPRKFMAVDLNFFARSGDRWILITACSIPTWRGHSNSEPQRSTGVIAFLSGRTFQRISRVFARIRTEFYRNVSGHHLEPFQYTVL